MRLLYLYLRSRLAGWAVLSIVTIATLSWVWLRAATDSGAPASMFLVAIPLLPAVVIGASTRSPFGDTELSASRSVPLLRFTHLAGLLLIGAISLAITATGWMLESIEWEFIRNLAGYTGLAFIGARILGRGICWVVPLGFGVITIMLDSTSRWAWAQKLPADRWSVTVSLALILVGLLLVTLQHPRDTNDDAP